MRSRAAARRPPGLLVRELSALIRQFAERQGVAVVIIEHDMALILNTCDRIVALDFGRKIADGTPQQVQADATVMKAYLGDPVEDAPASSAVEAGTS